jgi:Leucine-rich repeat (LRR) protein
LLAELQDLDLSDNLVKEISGLESCLELTSLDLSQNKIKKVTALHSN